VKILNCFGRSSHSAPCRTNDEDHKLLPWPSCIVTRRFAVELGWKGNWLTVQLRDRTFEHFNGVCGAAEIGRALFGNLDTRLHRNLTLQLDGDVHITRAANAIRFDVDFRNR
jgi:hypothetical protein